MARQALNDPAEIPAELDRWNWGAFFLNWIWGIGNSTFVALLALIPGVNFIMMIVLGARGSRWAWRNRAWRDAEHFRKSQRAWATAGIIVWFLVIGGCSGVLGGLPLILKSSEAYRLTMDTVRADERVKAAIGEDIEAAYWIFGNVKVGVGVGLGGIEGDGLAQYQIPVHGNVGSGKVVSRAIRRDGEWKLLVLAVRIDGSETPIVIINNGNEIPGSEIGV